MSAKEHQEVHVNEEKNPKMEMEQSQAEEAEKERDNYKWICRLLIEVY